MIETLISTRACPTATEGPHVETCRINERQTKDQFGPSWLMSAKPTPPYHHQLPPAATLSLQKVLILSEVGH